MESGPLTHTVLFSMHASRFGGGDVGCGLLYTLSLEHLVNGIRCMNACTNARMT